MLRTTPDSVQTETPLLNRRFDCQLGRFHGPQCVREYPLRFVRYGLLGSLF